VSVVIHAGLSSKIGLGHASRSRSMALEFLSVGVPATVVLEDPDREFQAFDWSGIQVIDVESRSRAIEAIGDLGGETLSSILVTDIPGLGRTDSVRARSQGYSFLAHLCLDGLSAYECDVFSNGRPGTLAVPSLSHRELLGPTYQVVRPEVVAARPREPWDGEEIHSILVAMGGADPFGISIKTARLLSRTGIALRVLIGPAFSARHIAELRDLGFSTIEAVAYRDLLDSLRSADLVVSQGGLMSTEVMCLGRPLALVRTEGLSDFTDALLSSGYGRIFNPGASSHQIETSINSSEWSSNALRAFNDFDGQGARRVVEEVLGLSRVGVS
jgi:spore coat polysaccharide biosynthesis predicted glycosyltransferase SpsG